MVLGPGGPTLLRKPYASVPVPTAVDAPLRCARLLAIGYHAGLLPDGEPFDYKGYLAVVR